jgi:hypothetical protein
LPEMSAQRSVCVSHWWCLPSVAPLAQSSRRRRWGLRAPRSAAHSMQQRGGVRPSGDPSARCAAVWRPTSHGSLRVTTDDVDKSAKSTHQRRPPGGNQQTSCPRAAAACRAAEHPLCTAIRDDAPHVVWPTPARCLAAAFDASERRHEDWASKDEPAPALAKLHPRSPLLNWNYRTIRELQRKPTCCSRFLENWR